MKLVHDLNSGVPLLGEGNRRAGDTASGSNTLPRLNPRLNLRKAASAKTERRLQTRMAQWLRLRSDSFLSHEQNK